MDSRLDNPPRAERRMLVPAIAICVIVVDLLLLLGNIAFLLVYQRQDADQWIFSNSGFDANNDHSFPEVFGYLQMAASLVLLGYLWRRRSAIFGALAVILVVIISDELFTLHERTGNLVAERYPDLSISVIGAQDIGEIVFWVAAAVLLTSILLIPTYLGAHETDRRAARKILSALAVLAFFAVGMDAVHSALGGRVSVLVFEAVGLTENFGELGSMTLLLIVLMRMARAEVLRSRAEAGAEAVPVSASARS